MASPTPAPLPATVRPRKSRRKGRYELQEEVGSGGMGTVYRALDRDLNRTVAVKVLRPELVPDLRNLLRLKRELVLASRVSDEHVVRVHDMGTSGGRALIAMDWVDGENLAQLLSRVHCLPPSQAISFATQICMALRAIHAANIIHRDLKPGNLLIRKDGVLLVGDFGLARSALPQDLTLTGPGESGGTPRYMAPEQLAGLPADSRSDLFALGLVLLETLTGTTALEALTPLRLRLLAEVCDKGRRSGEVRCLAALEVVIRRCVRLDRTERYASADAVLDDLKMARVDTQEGAPSGNRVLLGSRAWRLALVSALLLLTLLGFLAARRRGVARAAQAERSYAQAMSLIQPQSSEPELRAALGALEQTVASNPKHVPAVRAQLQALIRLYERTHDSQWLVKARATLDANTASLLSMEERTLLRARIDLDAGLFQDVIRSLQSDSALRSSSEDANRLLGRALAATQQIEQALDSYRAAIRLNPESWLAHNDLGYALLSLGRPEGARKEFVRVTELQPDSQVGYLGVGIALLDTGDLAGAGRNFETALERMASPETYYDLGVTAYYSRQYATAIPFFEAALRMRPDSDRYLAAWGDVLRHLHRRDQARDAYSHALALLENQTRPLTVAEQCRRALAFARLGDRDTAKSILDEIPSNSAKQEVAIVRAVLALLDGRPSASNRYLAEAVRYGYPAARVEMNPDFDDAH